MNSLILSTICAAAIGTADIQAQDTVDVYIINGVTIENFDGSQLEGKRVISYDIARKQGEPVRVHSITLEKDSYKGTIVLSPEEASQIHGLSGVIQGAKQKVTIKKTDGETQVITINKSANANKPSSMVYVIDGKKSDVASFKNLSPRIIKSISILKKPEQVKEYTDIPGAVVMLISTK